MHQQLFSTINVVTQLSQHTHPSNTFYLQPETGVLAIIYNRFQLLSLFLYPYYIITVNKQKKTIGKKTRTNKNQAKEKHEWPNIITLLPGNE